MNPPRLDRLSALLEGLAPVVSLADTPSGHDTVSGPNVSDQGLRLYLLTGGSLMLRCAGQDTPVQASALVALRAAAAHRLLRVQPGKQGRLICAHARLTGPVATLFLEEFAQPRVLCLTDDEPALRLATTMIETELAAPRCGQPALLDRAGDILFIGLLRYLVAHPRPQGAGLFNGLADPRIARSLVAMHRQPGAAWSLERLAQEAGMSRTAFAATFREVMHRTPGKYLSAIRLAMARRAVDMGKGLKEAARSSGYRNVSALSRALSRSRLQGAETA